MLLNKHKKNHSPKGNRLLISITVLGSAGPIRFVVNEEELVAAVIDTALKSYAREGRLPILGSNFDDFLLYCPNYGSDGEYFSQFQSVIRYQFGILSLICCPCLGSQLWVPGTQLGRKVPGIFCCARRPRVRGQPMMEDQQLPSLARAAEAGSRGSTSHSASKSPPIEEFTIIEMTQRLDGNNSFAFILFTHSVLFQSVTIAEVWISPGVTASCLRYS